MWGEKAIVPRTAGDDTGDGGGNAGHTTEAPGPGLDGIAVVPCGCSLPDARRRTTIVLPTQWVTVPVGVTTNELDSVAGSPIAYSLSTMFPSARWITSTNP